MGAGIQRWWKPLDLYEIERLDLYEIERLEWLHGQFNRVERIVITSSTTHLKKLLPVLAEHVATLRMIGTMR